MITTGDACMHDPLTNTPHTCAARCRGRIHCSLTYDCAGATEEDVLREARRLYAGLPVLPLQVERLQEWPPVHTTVRGRLFGLTAAASPRWRGWLLYWQYTDGRTERRRLTLVRDQGVTP